MVQITRISCSWCDTMMDYDEAAARGKATYCANCGHRADVAKAQCDCRQCAERNRLFAIREREQERRGETY